MIRDLYTRPIDDPYYEKYTLEERTELGVILSKIRMILGTKHGEVLGEYNLGMDLESLIFKTKVSSVQIEQEITSQLSKYVNFSHKYKITTKVKFGHHQDGYDYGIVEIYVNDGLIQGYVVD